MNPQTQALNSLIHLYAQLAIVGPAISGMVLAMIGIAAYRALEGKR